MISFFSPKFLGGIKPSKTEESNGDQCTGLCTMGLKLKWFGLWSWNEFPNNCRVIRTCKIDCASDCHERISNVENLCHAGSNTSLKVTQFQAKYRNAAKFHPSYSIDLSSSDFFLFTRLKSCLKGYRFDNFREFA